MQQTIERLQSIEGVAKITAHDELAQGFSTMERVVQFVSVAIIVLLLVVSLFIISNTVKLAMYDRKEEIAIMKMVGATNGFIQFPFVVQGFILGAFSAVIAFLVEWGIYDLLVTKIAEGRLHAAVPVRPLRERRLGHGRDLRRIGSVCWYFRQRYVHPEIPQRVIQEVFLCQSKNVLSQPSSLGS